VNKKIEGVAFDLDGTLYSNALFYLRVFPVVLRHWPLMLAMNKARKILHGAGPPGAALPDFPPEQFYDIQAGLMAQFLKKERDEIKARAERYIYRRWEPIFGRLPLFPGVMETLAALRNAGVRLALLSDFPPETKLANFGIRAFWDVVLCTEVIGRLKPDPLPFRVLAERMALPPEKILYVGNSVRYDIRGAKAAGMSAAWIRPSLFRGAKAGGGPGGKRSGGADFVFTGYRQLAAFVLR
jgi:putative hydrolase of the HAD superfamily